MWTWLLSNVDFRRRRQAFDFPNIDTAAIARNRHTHGEADKFRKVPTYSTQPQMAILPSLLLILPIFLRFPLHIFAPNELL